MRGIGPNKRPTALIFQNLALFPLMTVWENIAFGLEVRGVEQGETAGARRRSLADRRSHGLGRQEDQPAVRRPETTRRDCPRACGRAEGDAARRAAVGPRFQAAAAHAQRASAPSRSARTSRSSTSRTTRARRSPCRTASRSCRRACCSRSEHLLPSTTNPRTASWPPSSARTICCPARSSASRMASVASIRPRDTSWRGSGLAFPSVPRPSSTSGLKTRGCPARS